MAGPSLMLFARRLSAQAGCRCLPLNHVISLTTARNLSTGTRLLSSCVVQETWLVLHLFHLLRTTEIMTWIEELGNMPRLAHHRVWRACLR